LNKKKKFKKNCEPTKCCHSARMYQPTKKVNSTCTRKPYRRLTNYLQVELGKDEAIQSIVIVVNR